MKTKGALLEAVTMKRKTLLMLFISAMLLTGCASTEITQTKTDTTVELGSACTLNITDYFELGAKVNEENIILDTSSVDVNTVGNYEAIVTYKKNTYQINVSVTDTTAPAITAKTDIEPVEAGITIKASDYVEVTDLSNCTVYFVTDDGETETIDIPSDYRENELKTTIIAVDAQDNRSEEITISLENQSRPLSYDEAYEKYMQMPIGIVGNIVPTNLTEDERRALDDAYYDSMEQVEEACKDGKNEVYNEAYKKYSSMSLDELDAILDDGKNFEVMPNEEYVAFWDAWDDVAYEHTLQQLRDEIEQSQQSQVQTPPRDPNAVYATGDEVILPPKQYEYEENSGIY